MSNYTDHDSSLEDKSKCRSSIESGPSMSSVVENMDYHSLPVGERQASSLKFWMLTAALTVLAGLLSVLLVLAAGVESREPACTTTTTPMGSEALNTNLPPDNEHNVLNVNFTENDLRYDLSTSSDQLWDDLVPPHNGFIYATDDNGQERLHSIAMFHQLHCLHMLRDLVRGLVDGTERINKQGLPLPTTHKHALHCFDYLVQGISCAADGTLEPTIQGQHNTSVVTGYNVVHECRDQGQLWALAHTASSGT